MKTFFETQAINMINTRCLKNENFQARFALVTSHIAQHWFSGSSREAQNLKLLVNSSQRSMLLLSTKLLIRKSSGYTQPNSIPLGM